MSVLLLVNPTSGRGRALKLQKATTEALYQAGHSPTVHVTVSLAEATELARAADVGTLIAVLGGDGFLGAVVAGAKDSGAVVLPLAGGSGNDSVRRLGLPLDPVKTIKNINALCERRVDLGVVNGRVFLGVANVGFDGLANELGNGAKINLGPLVYLYGGIKAFLSWRNVSFTLYVEGGQREFPGWLVAVGNVGQYGGGLRICPESKVDDGALDVVSLGNASILRVAEVFVRSYRGKHLQVPGISSMRGREIRIESGTPLNIYADGEKVGPLPATISVIPHAVKVLVPKNSPVFR
ncbi:lipid kinase [Arthrobacter sp. MYb227]|uniref:diacylglycerol/lipid kinase family protein n=1 Tax=Arthrobacter sp. MYb227 TaxID=1848601 RepID=UPI000CFAD1F2|nr:diacylglycerol kinase family protein [Arthrobacter sp. MYb227]PQZ92322.1 lipid kinase [Arthrobacter sp. MYb227]